jgi:hypothetical protein
METASDPVADFDAFHSIADRCDFARIVGKRYRAELSGSAAAALERRSR